MKIQGMDVFDATKSLMINITDSDVAKGKGKDPAACAAAVAAMRSLGASRARVHLSRVYLELDPQALGIKSRKSKVWIRYQTSGSLRAEIIALDRGGKMAAGAHKLIAPKPCIQLAKRKKQERNKNAKKVPQRGNRATYHHTVDVRARGANK